jgi:leucyl-tRNA synthetase
VKFGFYDFQSARDWYREVTVDDGMHVDLVLYWIRNAALLITPVAPHFAENIWSDILKEPKSVQLALWPTPTTPVDRTIIEAGQYMRGTIKTIRDAEVSLLKAINKAKGKKNANEAAFDPKKPKGVRVYVATQFPEWQDTCVQVIQDAYSKETDKVDDAKVKDLLTEKGLIKDKRAMPFIQLFKVRLF